MAAIVGRACQWSGVATRTMSTSFSFSSSRKSPWVRGALLRGLAGCDHPGGLGEHLPVDVAEEYDLHRRDLYEPEQVALAVPAATDQSDSLRVRAGEFAGRGAGMGQGQPGGAGTEQLATIHGVPPRDEQERGIPALESSRAKPARRPGSFERPELDRVRIEDGF